MNRPLLLVLGASLAFTVSAHAIQITEYPLPTGGTGVVSLTAGPDGRLWFPQVYDKKLGAVTTSGVFSAYPLKSQPRFVATIPGPGLAVAESNVSGIAFANVDGTLTEYPGLTNPRSLVFGPDGRLWIADEASALTAFHYLANSPPTSTIPLPSSAVSVTVGRDGRIWAASYNAKKISGCFVETGTCVHYPVTGLPTNVAAGPDGSLWFTEPYSNLVGRVTRTGAVAEFPVPTPDGHPYAICAGPDGNMWFTELEGSKIARITPEGKITEWALPPGTQPTAIALGPDGNLWFVAQGRNMLAKLDIHVQADADGDGATDVADVFFLVNHLFAGGPAPK